MSNTHITINQYQELLKRITGLEQKVEHKELPTNIYKDVDELKKDYPALKKDVEITSMRFSSLEEKMDYRFDVMDEKFTGKFNTQDVKFIEMDKRLNMIWKLLIVMFGITITTFIAIITVIGLLLRTLGII